MCKGEYVRNKLKRESRIEKFGKTIFILLAQRLC